MATQKIRRGKPGPPRGYQKRITSIPELRKELRTGTTAFRFKKIRGSPRRAVGTQLLSEIPKRAHPKNPGSSSPKVATFYDKKKKAWRCVSERGDHVHIAATATPKKRK